MPTPSIESAVYTFEGLLPELESPPIAARRALDHAGQRLSVEGWRSLPLDERHRHHLRRASSIASTSTLVFSLLVRRASPAPQKISAASDPDPAAPPEALANALEPTRSIDARRWGRLRAVDRYALAHTYRRAVARSAFSILVDAFDAVFAAGPSHQEARRPSERPSSPPPPPGAAGAYQPAGYYSSLLTPPDPRPAVPPPTQPAHETPPQPRAAALAAAGRFPTVPPPSMEHGRERAPFAEHGRDRAPREQSPTGAGVLSNHLDPAGEVHMVDVADKPRTERRAVATGSVRMRPETLARLVNRDTPKGEVLATARLAAIMAAKRTSELIPLCHLVALTHLEVLLDVDAQASSVHVTALADVYDRTGCEMEAMVAVSIGCLTIYDMLKGIDRDMVISDVKLMEKSGGRSGHYQRGDGR